MRCTGVLCLGVILSLGSSLLAQRPVIQDAAAEGVGKPTASEDRATVGKSSHQDTRRNTTQQSRTLQKVISVDLENQSLLESVRQIQRLADAEFIYPVSTFSSHPKRVTLHVPKITVGEALERILGGTNIRVVSDSAGMVSFVIADAKAQNPQSTGTIHGEVADSASGNGIAGVTVAIQGTRLTTTTDAKGEFTLANVPVGDWTVSFKLLGYVSATRSVRVEENRRAPLRVVLRQSATILSGVVTTATGEQRKLEVGHTVTTINVDSIIKVAPVMSVTDILESRVPGMTIQRSSGTPGDPARIRVRGGGSINANNDPIIVVDGIRMYSEQSSARNLNESGEQRVYATPSPLDQIDVNTIETIEVLKGPSASAMYGSDAANGVIIVTTKRGRPGPPRWNLSGASGISYQPGSWPMSMYKWTTPFAGGLPELCAGFCGDAQVDSVVMFQALNNPYLTVLGRGSTFGSSANVSGGSQTMTYNFSASTGRERGVLKLPAIEADRYQKFQDKPVPGWMRRPDLLTRRGGQGSVRIEFSPRIGLTATTQFNQTQQHRTSMSSSTNTAINELQGRWVDLSLLDETPLLGNPYERVRTTINNLSHNVELRTTPVSWLPIATQVGVSTLTSNTEMTIARGLLTTNESGGVLRGITRTSSELTGASRTTIPVMNRVNLSAGVNFNRGSTYDQSGAFFGIADGVSDPSRGQDSARNEFSRSTSDKVSFGWFLEPRLNVQSRFFVMPGFRLDNNGLSGKNARLNGLPKMNLSWVVSEERYFPWKDLFQMVRLRTAFGVSSVQPSAAAGFRLYARRPVVNLYNDPDPFYGDMLQLSNLGNTRIRPERVREFEGGIDMELLRNRLSLEWTLYRKLRYDAIVSNPYGSSVDGGGSISMNVGDIDGRGTELSLQAQIIERPRVAFQLGVTFDRSANKVLRLTSDGDSLATIGRSSSFVNRNALYKVGYPIEGQWMRPILGYKDLDEDGWISSSELVIGPEDIYVGTTEPKYKMAFHPRLSFFRGRLNVAATVSYIQGQMQTIEPKHSTTYGDLIGEGNAPYKWSLIQGPEGFDRQVAALAAFNVVDNNQTIIGYAQHVNITRLQSVSVSANLGQNLTRWVRARNASISLQGSNLGLWTSYLGVDPNVNAAASGADRSLRDTGQQPEPRIWQLRISLGY